MLEDPYFAQPHPKSTGREKFNKAWLEKSIQHSGFSIQKEALHSDASNHSSFLTPHSSLHPRDVQRTLLELTAISISNEVLKSNPDILLLCGGGAKNALLVERLAVLMPNVQTGIAKDADNIEAMTFAWLAYKRLHNEHVNLKDVTGASRNAILGGVYA